MKIAITVIYLLFMSARCALAWTAGSTGWCTDASGRNFRCSDAPSGGGGGGGGNNQAAMDAFNTGMALGQQIANMMQQQALNQAVNINNQGVEYERDGNIDAALQAYRQAAGMNPGDAVIQDNLRRIYGKKAEQTANEYAGRRDWEMAIQSMQEALNYDPNNGDYKAYVEMLKEWQIKDEPRRQKIAELNKSKEKVDQMLDNLASQLGTENGAGAASGLEFAKDKESLFSKGDTSSSVVDLSHAKLDQAPQISVPQASKIADYSTIYPECQDKSLDCGVRTELILDAVKAGGGSWEQSVISLEKEAQSRGGATPVYQQAISYLEGFQSYEKWSLEKQAQIKAMAKKDFSPDKEDSLSLLEKFGQESKSDWLGPKRPASSLLGGMPATDHPDNWKLERMKTVVASLDKNKDDVNATILYLEKKVRENPKDNASINALNFLRGYQGYSDFVKEKGVKK